MNIFLKIQNTPHLAKNEKLIMQMILDDPETFLKMSAKEICDHCYVSIPTLYRLCHKLDLVGLAELKVQISGSLNAYREEKNEFNFNYPVQRFQTQHEVLTMLKEDYEQTNIATFNLFDLDQLRLCVSALKKAKQIDIYTSAGNLFFAKNFQFQMSEINVDVHVPSEDYAQRLSAASSDKTHVAIVISFGGRGLLYHKVMPILKKNHTPIILISSVEPLPYSELATYHLYMCSYESHYNKMSSFSTRMSLLYILDALYACYFKTDFENYQKIKIENYKGFYYQDEKKWEEQKEK